MEIKKVPIDYSTISNRNTLDLDISQISSDSLQGFNLNDENKNYYKNLEPDINCKIQLNNKNNSELESINKKKTNYTLRRTIPLIILLGLIFYFNHISEKSNFENYDNQLKKFSPNSCILEIFSENLYKSSWKFFIVNKKLKVILLTVLFYFYDLIFFISCIYWILNYKKENWSFLFSLTILGLFKYFSSEFYLMKNHEDTLWNLPKFPFFLTIQSENNNENYFFSSSTSLFLIIIKQLKDNKLNILKNLTYIFMILNITMMTLLRIQTIYGIMIGLTLGLYLNIVSDNTSTIFNHIYSFKEEEKIKNKDVITIDFENKIKENIEKIMRDKKYVELKNINEKSQV